jgi:hypothetical protein
MREITFENKCLIVSSLEQKNTSLIPVPILLNKIIFYKNNLDDRYDAKKLWYLSFKFSYYLLMVSPIASAYYTWKLLKIYHSHVDSIKIRLSEVLIGLMPSVVLRHSKNLHRA